MVGLSSLFLLLFCFQFCAAVACSYLIWRFSETMLYLPIFLNRLVNDPWYSDLTHAFIIAHDRGLRVSALEKILHLIPDNLHNFCHGWIIEVHFVKRLGKAVNSKRVLLFRHDPGVGNLFANTVYQLAHFIVLAEERLNVRLLDVWQAQRNFPVLLLFDLAEAVNLHILQLSLEELTQLLQLQLLRLNARKHLIVYLVDTVQKFVRVGLQDLVSAAVLQEAQQDILTSFSDDVSAW